MAAGNGRVRWRAPASPSRVDHGVGLHIGTVQDGRTVVWMQPGRVYPDGDVSVVAADTGTGARRWSYGGGVRYGLSEDATFRFEVAKSVEGLLANLAVERGF